MSISGEKYGLTVQDVVQILGICERKVRGLIAEDEIPYFRIGRSVRISWPELQEWIAFRSKGRN